MATKSASRVLIAEIYESMAHKARASNNLEEAAKRQAQADGYQAIDRLGNPLGRRG